MLTARFGIASHPPPVNEPSERPVMASPNERLLAEEIYRRRERS
jgi:hypothetical protein